MVPPPIPDDYYMVLEVERSATHELIVKSYERLALKLHPDRNVNHDTIEAFQLLRRAYETLKDSSKRQAYDLNYPSFTGRCPSPQNTQPSHPSPTSTPQREAVNEAEQIAALQKSKLERDAQWRIRKNAFDSSILELRRDIQRLEQEIQLKEADLQREENRSREAKEEVDAADLDDDRKIQIIQARISKHQWEAAEALRKQQAEERGSTRQAYTSTCHQAEENYPGGPMIFSMDPP